MAARQLRISTLDDLVAAMHSEDLGLRVKVLQAISAAPDKALAFGKKDGRDILDILLGYLSEQPDGSATWRALSATIIPFDDPRVVAFFHGTLADSKVPDSLFLSATRLSREPLEPLHEFLVACLLQNVSQARAEAAADLLAELEGLDAETRLRLSLLDRVPHGVPPPNEETVPLWLAELEGIFFRDARRCLEGHGGLAYDALRPHWDTFTQETKSWLLRWGTWKFPERTEEILQLALAQSDSALLMDALCSLAEFDGDKSAFSARLHDLAQQADPELRLAAIQAGARVVDWRRIVEQENDPRIRAACLARYTEEAGEAAIPDITAFLCDSDWRMRATARDALINFGDAAVEPVKVLINHEDDRVRFSAAQVLFELGQEDWLEQRFS